LTTSLSALRAAVGTPRDVRRKLVDAGRTVFNLLNRRERHARYARLQARGLAGARPTDWQLWLAASHMLRAYLLPSNLEFYEAYGRSHWWAQVLRFLDEPSAMIDPIGLGISRDMVVSHLVQVVHASAGYDIVLLCMFEDGIEALRGELEQLVAGTHPRQEALALIIEREDYHAALLEALDRWAEEPHQHWRVQTVPAPPSCTERFDWGIETFGTPERLFAYARTLPPTPGEALVACWSGDLVLPRPS
jgi:hypothetical protein